MSSTNVIGFYANWDIEDSALPLNKNEKYQNVTKLSFDIHLKNKFPYIFESFYDLKYIYLTTQELDYLKSLVKFQAITL